jgi:hypothetical protein
MATGGGLDSHAADMIFLSENNTVINAHAGASVVLSCKVQKEGKFALVSQFKVYFELNI